VHLPDLADDAASDERLAVALRAARRDLDPHLRGELLPARILGERARFPERGAERLLHVDGLSALHRLERDEAVHVIGRRDVHGVDVLVLLLEELAPVLVHANLRKPLLKPLEPSEIDIGHRDEIERRVFGKREQVAERLARGADARMPQHRGRRAGTNGDEGGNGCGCGDGLKELSACQIGLGHERQRTATLAGLANSL
jgi:hypothetical protein